MTYRYPGGLVRRTAANTSITGASGVWDLGSQAQAVKNNTWPISGLALPVSGSLRFRNSNSAYLYKIYGTSPTSRTTMTWSGWVKRGILSSGNKMLFGTGNNYENTYFNSSDVLVVNGPYMSGQQGYFVTTQVFRDPAAWYHIVVVYDTTNATATDRLRLYVNGTRVTSFSTSVNSNQNNTTTEWLVSGKYSEIASTSELNYFDGYMAELNVVDGQALDASYFGQTSPITGVWEPIKYTGTYGTNGFYLSLSDTSSIGKDFSGNGNNWTPNNISTTSGATFDLMRDVPTQWAPQSVTDIGGTVRGNYATLNPIWRRSTWGAPTVTDGNLFNYRNNSHIPVVATMAIKVPTYWEVTISETNQAVGIIDMNTTYTGTYSYADPSAKGIYCWTIDGYINGSNIVSPGGPIAAFTGVATIMFAVDPQNGKMWVGKNGVWNGDPSAGTSAFWTNLSTNTEYVPWIHSAASTQSNDAWANFGQRAFAYTPPTGFKSLCTTNLPTPTIGATTATAASKYFNTVLYTGTGSTNPITGVGFQPDWVWGKRRNSTGNNWIFDAVRGAGNQLVLNNTNAEVSGSTEFASFDSDGFTVTSTAGAFNASGSTYVAWNWNAGGSTVTNTAGSITSQVRASTTAGFSIATFTGNGTAGATVGHGLGVAPSMIMFKERLTGTSGLVWHTGYGTNQGQMLIDSTAAIYNPGNGLYFNSTYPSSTVVTLGTSGATNGNGSNYVLYSWAPVAGYSAFGSYTGNGSTDGPFIYTGFRPRFVMIKGASNLTNVTSWSIWDTSRNSYNLTATYLNPNTTDAEYTDTNYTALDILSNGFKIRSTNTYGINQNAGSFIYMAFAESPFKYSLAR